MNDQRENVVFDPEQILAVLHEHRVAYVLIGGMAAVLHGDIGVTVDVDIVPDKRDDNTARLAAALRHLEAKLRAPDAPLGLPFDCSREFFDNLADDAILNLATHSGSLDLTYKPSGTHGYRDLARAAMIVELGPGRSATVAALADVIRSKEAAGREKDRLALPRLRRLLDSLKADPPNPSENDETT